MCGLRVLRGGSWNNNPQNLRAARRNRNNTENRNNNIGFRVASTAAARAARITVLAGVQGPSRAVHDDHGRGKWFARVTALVPALGDAWAPAGTKVLYPLRVLGRHRERALARVAIQEPFALGIGASFDGLLRFARKDEDETMNNNARRTGPSVEAHYRFLEWLIPTVEKFPRTQKFLLGDRIQQAALDVLEDLIQATYTRQRRTHLDSANLGLEKLRFFFRLALDLKYLDDRRYEHAARCLDETGRLIGGWMKSETAHVQAA